MKSRTNKPRMAVGPKRRKSLLPDGLQVGRMLVLTGNITQTTVRRLARLLDESDEPLTLVISSAGGDIDAAMAMHEMLRLRKSAGGVVATAGFGAVMSAAVLLLASGTKGSRCLSKYSRLMYHESKANFGGSLSHLKSAVSALDDYDRDFDAIIAEYTGLSTAQVHKLNATGDKWLTAEEALTFGFVDKLI